MKDIRCPSCGKNFRIDPTSYDELLSQIKNDEFNQEITKRLKLANAEKIKDIELTKKELLLKMADEKKDMEKKIISLQSKLSNADKEKLNTLLEFKNESEREKNILNAKIDKLNNEMSTQEEINKISREKEVINAVTDLEKEKNQLIISI